MATSIKPAAVLPALFFAKIHCSSANPSFIITLNHERLFLPSLKIEAKR